MYLYPFFLFFFSGDKTDIFSLGCVYYYTLSGGRHPFGTGERQHAKGHVRINIIINLPLFVDLFVEDATWRENNCFK